MAAVLERAEQPPRGWDGGSADNGELGSRANGLAWDRNHLRGELAPHQDLEEPLVQVGEQVAWTPWCGPMRGPARRLAASRFEPQPVELGESALVDVAEGLIGGDLGGVLLERARHGRRDSRGAHDSHELSP